jgi:predicted RNase H-like HicB family nuclease
MVLIEDPEEHSFRVFVPSLPGVVTFGTSIDEALARAKEAVSVHVAGLVADTDVLPDSDGLALLTEIEVDETGARGSTTAA